MTDLNEDIIDDEEDFDEEDLESEDQEDDDEISGVFEDDDMTAYSDDSSDDEF